jgi:hypothetical protein
MYKQPPYNLTAAEIRESAEFLELIRATRSTQRPLRTQPAQSYVHSHMNRVQEAMLHMDLDHLADRSAPLNLPSGVTEDALLKELGKLLFEDITTPRYGGML